jgi:hypothetical protein
MLAGGAKPAVEIKAPAQFPDHRSHFYGFRPGADESQYFPAPAQ